MVDYQELIKELDTSNVREKLVNVYDQVSKGIRSAKDLNIIEEIDKIVICGMGGSALPGYILKQYLNNLHIPIFVIEDYDIPAFVDSQSLVFVISYSGNAEETLSFYKQAVRIGAKLISITSGGKLKELSEFNKTKLVLIDGGIPSSLAYGLLFFPMLQILINSKLIFDESENIKKLVNSLKRDDYESMGRSLASKIIGKTPIIYSSKKLEVVSLKWKINFNKISNLAAYYNVFPSLTHNEINQYQDSNNDYYVIFLRDEKENKRVSKQIDIAKKIIKEHDILVTEIGINGDCYLTRIFIAILIGDWTSYYLAIMNETNPETIKNIDKLTEQLRKV